MMTFHLHIWFGVNVRQRNQPANCVRESQHVSYLTAPVHQEAASVLGLEQHHGNYTM